MPITRQTLGGVSQHTLIAALNTATILIVTATVLGESNALQQGLAQVAVQRHMKMAFAAILPTVRLKEGRALEIAALSASV